MWRRKKREREYKLQILGSLSRAVGYSLPVGKPDYKRIRFLEFQVGFRRYEPAVKINPHAFLSSYIDLEWEVEVWTVNENDALDLLSHRYMKKSDDAYDWVREYKEAKEAESAWVIEWEKYKS